MHPKPSSSLRTLVLQTAASLAVFAALPAAHAEVKVAKGHSPIDSGFKLDPVPTPATNDAATAATFSVVDGRPDGNSGALAVLNDGKMPKSEDDPRGNFFFTTGSDGGRLAVDLGSAIAVKTVASYSWHGGDRAPQIYKLYAADGAAKDFNAAPKRGTDPRTCGWKLIAEIDTRAKENNGGQQGVEISDRGGRALGDFRYLLFDIDRTAKDDPHANTFFSEIDVIDAKGPAPERFKAAERIVRTYTSKDGKFRYIVDSTKAPGLTEWSEKELIPTIEMWYPKLAALMPSEGYKVPDVVTFEYKDDMGGTPAYAAGNKISLNAPWFPGELKREAKGCVIHEMGHVVQNYWRARQTNRNPSPTPGWITEGICDYIRWFLYEPESHGAEVRDPRQAKYDASYRTTANFLDWVIRKKDKDLLRKLNAAAREGRYSEKLWKDWTGKTVQELGEEWKAEIADKQAKGKDR